MSYRLGSHAMFDRIAPRYDLLNRLLSLGIDQRWRRLAVDALALEPDAVVLDVATGTADMAVELARRSPAIRVTGLDGSAGMLASARTKVRRAGLAQRVELVRGDAEALPFDAESFDAATMAFGIRNISDRVWALRELGRVLRPGGRLVVLELAEPRWGLLGRAARFHLHVVVPWLGGLVSGHPTEYRYLQRSVEAFPPPGEFASLLAAAGLEVGAVRPLDFGVATLFVAAKAAAPRDRSATAAPGAPSEPRR